MFHCDKCGECCRHLPALEIYEALHDGDGVCRYLSKNICTIYENRPLMCRVDEAYEKIFSASMTREEYYRLNENACEALKKGR